MNLLAAGWFAENGKIGPIVKQGLEDVGVGINLTVPDRPTSIKRIYTDYDFDVAISNQAIRPSRCRRRRNTTRLDGIEKGAAFRNASAFHTDEVDALVEQIKVEIDPAKRKALVVDFQKIATREAPNLPLLELETDHHGQHQGAEPLQRSQLPRGQLARHMAGVIASSRRVATLRLLQRRLVQAVPLMLGVVVINFILIHLAPGSFLELMTAENQVSDPATVELLRTTYGVDDPVWLQLAKYIWALMHLDFGFSYRQNMPVIDAIAINLPATLLLMGSSIALAFVVGVAAGVVASTKVRTFWDSLVSLAAMFFFAAPCFWLGIMMIVLFAVKLGWMPVGGMAHHRRRRRRPLAACSISCTIWCLPPLALACSTPRSMPASCAPPCWRSRSSTSCAPRAPKGCRAAR